MIEKIKRVKLNRGTEVYFLFCPKYTTSTVQFVFPVGWRHDDQKYLGLAHFFEHLVGKRTTNYPNKAELNRLLETRGILSNAYTSGDYTCYHHSSTHEELIFSLEKILEAIYFSQFKEEDLEMEKSVVLTEARQYLDDDDSFLWHKMSGQIFPGTTLSKFFFGTQETLKRIDTQVFSEFYKIYLNPENVKIFIGTNNLTQSQKIIKLLKNFYNKQSALLTDIKIPKLSEPKLSPPTAKERFLLINKKNKAQSNLRLSWRIGPLSENERIVFIVLRRLLVFGFSARLLKKLRDELGLIYSIGFYRDIFLGGMHYMSFYTSCKKASKDKVFNIILEEIQKIKTDLTQKEVDSVIPMLEYLEQRQDNVENDISRLIDSVIYNTKYLTSKQFIHLIRGVKVKDVVRLIEKLFVTNQEYKTILE